MLKRDLTKYKNVFIDESHRFRTEDTQSYELLAQICRGKRVILVSATPLNNTPQDILSQIKLFQPGKNSTSRTFATSKHSSADYAASWKVWNGRRTARNTSRSQANAVGPRENPQIPMIRRTPQ